MNSLAHIINPFKAEPHSDLYSAQPITFESIRKAKDKAEGIINVELLTAQFAEDAELIPKYFRKTSHLSRSVIDVEGFEKKIKLPLLSDILEKLFKESNADYLIYSNVDIGLYEDFYIKVNEFINQGYDAFIINRRRLKNTYSKASDLPVIYLDKGKTHPGFDCFVFHRSIYPKLKLENICIGVPFVEISFSQNLFAFSKNFRLFDTEYLTFHIGEEIFKKRTPKEYFNFNRQQFRKIIPQLWAEFDIKKIPYAYLPLPIRLIKWGLHPCLPIKLMIKGELKRLKIIR